MPVYNGERYLAGALDAILGQTYVDFELVVGDNGSTDGTAEILAAYERADERMRVLPSSVNHGAAWNYNRVFQATRAPLFRWAAYDDLVLPTYLEVLVPILADGPEAIVLAQTTAALIDEDGNDAGMWDDRFDLAIGRPSRRFSQLIRHLVMSNVLFGLMRRSAVEQTRLHGAFPSADYVFLAELSLLGTFASVPERLFLRRVHGGMSRYANTTLEDVADWFEPGSGSDVRPEMLRLFAAHLSAIGRSPLRFNDRLLAYSEFFPAWLRRHHRTMAHELWALARKRPTMG